MAVTFITPSEIVGARVLGVSVDDDKCVVVLDNGRGIVSLSGLVISWVKEE